MRTQTWKFTLFIVGILMLLPIVNSVTITGFVTEQTGNGSIGEPISDVTVTAYINESKITDSITDEEGKFILDIKDNYGEYTLTSKKEDYFDGGFGIIRIHDGKGYSLSKGELTMAKIKWSNIFGNISSNGGTPEQGVIIKAESWFGNFTNTTDANGEYSIRVPMNIPFTVTVQKEGYISTTMTNVYAHNISIDFSIVNSTPKEPTIPKKTEINKTESKGNQIEKNESSDMQTPNEESKTNLSPLIFGVIVVLIIIIAIVWFLKKKGPK